MTTRRDPHGDMPSERDKTPLGRAHIGTPGDRTTVQGATAAGAPAVHETHADESQGEEHGHEHRDVSGGWLRPGVFGAMDGLVTNTSLIAGVGGGHGSAHIIVLTGLAGLVAGAFSMATGEYTSVSSQNELTAAEVNKERRELVHNSAAERAELTEMLQARGMSADVAAQASAQISQNTENALAVHAMEELGVDPSELPSPVTAAGASLLTFAAGAIVPLVPYLAGLNLLAIALAFAAVGAVVGGGAVSVLTSRPFWRGALRQVLLAALAVAVTYGIGTAIGTHVS